MQKSWHLHGYGLRGCWVGSAAAPTVATVPYFPGPSSAGVSVLLHAKTCSQQQLTEPKRARGPHRTKSRGGYRGAETAALQARRGGYSAHATFGSYRSVESLEARCTQDQCPRKLAITSDSLFNPSPFSPTVMSVAHGGHQHPRARKYIAWLLK